MRVLPLIPGAGVTDRRLPAFSLYIQTPMYQPPHSHSHSRSSSSPSASPHLTRLTTSPYSHPPPTVWQSQDKIAPAGGISIPTDPGAGGPASGDAWSNGAGDADRERDREHDRDRDRENGGGGGGGGGGRGGGGRGRSRSPGPARDGEKGHNPGNNLHVSNLGRKIDTRDLEAAFAQIGRVKKASVMYDPHTRESRGFGFVTMETPEEADAAVAALQGTDLGGKSINVEKVCPSFIFKLLCTSRKGAHADSGAVLWAAEEGGW
ncbi:hypothetical protein B0H12DRAFT_1230894 [Mycena haematopus]|nr:hypothetical protein B0H12DRAFT_1230894 [Mycena haematopus]